MFRCQICGQVASPGTRATKVTVVSREKVYSSRGGGDSDFRGRGRFRAPSKPKDKGGKGHEIVQELMACQGCADKQVTQVVKMAVKEEVAVEETTVAPEAESSAETDTTATAETEVATEAAEAPAATEEAEAKPEADA